MQWKRSASTDLKRLLVKIVLLINGSPAIIFAQPAGFPHPEQLTGREGLPQSFVSGLVQDHNGFVWVATRNGLARYDGIHFKLFQHNIHDTTTLASNTLIWIHKNATNQLWIEYESGEIDVMNPATEQVEHLTSRYFLKKGSAQFVRRGWLIDSDQRFWGIIKAAGLNSIDPHRKTVERYTRQTHRLPSDTLYGLLEDRNRHLWVLSQRRISGFQKQTGRFLHYTLPVAQDFKSIFDSDREVVDLHQRQNGELMWGDRQRIFFFHPVRHSVRVVPLPSRTRMGLLWIRTGPDGRDYFEADGVVYRYDDRDGLVVIFKKGAGQVLDARSFLVDRSGLIWIGTDARGIYQLDLTTPAFPAFPNRGGFHQDVLEKELHNSLNRLFDWKPKDEQFSASSYHVRSAYDATGRLWMALKETVCWYDSRRQQWTRLPPVPIVTDRGEAGIGIKGMTFTAAGNLMVVGYNGRILVYNPAAKKWLPFIDNSLIRSRYGLLTLPQAILADQDKIWITTEHDGLLIIDIRTRQSHQLKHDGQPGSLPTNQLLGLQPDPIHPDRLWIGSYQGLVCLNKKTLKCEVFSLGEGLPDNTIYSIQADQSGALWITTNKGLCRFDPVSRQIRVFQTLHGLPGNEFNRFHHLRLPDGRLAFGGTDGWTLFDPLAIKKDQFEPTVAFTDLKINNRLVSPGVDNPILPVPLNALDKLVLSPEQNTLTIEFAGLQFNQPQAIEYRYQLLGYDDRWVLAGHTPLANYTKIPPGTYTLRVNASNTTGQWSSHIKAIKLVMTPPWWRTWWAFLVYILLIAGCVWYGLRIYLNRLRLQQVAERRRQEAHQLRMLDEMKSRFFTNVTHDFRTPLTLILSPMEGLIRDLSETPYQKRLESVQRNARQLLALINQLLDFSKVDARLLAVNESRGNLAELVGQTLQLFEEEATVKTVDVRYESTVWGEYWFDSGQLERILSNLVANALKFTPAGGTITVSLQALNGILLAVTDTGVGIAAEQLPSIFDRFFQVDPAETDASPHSDSSPRQAGTGIGLALVKELVQLQRGTIEVESQPGAGTTFRVQLPYQRAEETAEETEPESSSVETISVDEFITNTGEKPHLLLVEDNPELADFIADSLPRHYRISRAENGAEGLEQAVAELPDLVISDVMMPVMDGYALCQHLKEDECTSHIPVILLTAKAAFDSRMEGLARGADDYLTKPFHVQELNLRVHNLLERQRRMRERVRQQLTRPDSAQSDPINPVLLDPFLEKLYAVVEARLDDTTLSVEALADEMSLSRMHLHRKVKALTELSSNEVIRNYRLKRATQLLRQGLSSTETAYRVGFDSPQYFAKCFRDLYQMSPSDFVRQG